MKRFLKREYLLIAFGVILFVVLNHLGGIFSFLQYVFGLLLPVIAGFILAFILNVPVRGFENLIGRVFKNSKRGPGPKLTRALSMIFTFIVLAGVVVLAAMLVVPMLSESIQNIYTNFIAHLPEFTAFLTKLGLDASKLTAWVSSHDSVNAIMKDILPGVFGFASNVVSGIVAVIMSVFVAIYALLSKDKLLHQSKRFTKAFFKEKTCERLYYAGNLLNYKYYKYLSGQFIEACILGVLGFAVLAIFGVPNALVIAFITSVLAFVPYVGAVTAFGIGALLTLISAPEKLIVYVVIYFIVQIVETQFICPHVVGNAVGLSPLWTLVAVFVGGSLFGLFGMIMFIPLFSVAVTILHEYVDKKLEKKSSGQSAPPNDATPQDTGGQGAERSTADNTPADAQSEVSVN